jgi:hypothetical protein
MQSFGSKCIETLYFVLSFSRKEAKIDFLYFGTEIVLNSLDLTLSMIG